MPFILVVSSIDLFSVSFCDNLPLLTLWHSNVLSFHNALSLPSMALLLSIQTGIALGGPCKPLPSITEVNVPTTAVSSETSPITLEATPTALTEPQITTSFNEDSTTTTRKESSTTSVADVTTTATIDGVSTTTSTDSPKGTPMVADFDGGSVEMAYIPVRTTDASVQLTSNPSIKPAPAVFAIDDSTNRLYTELPDGTVLFATTTLGQSDPSALNFNIADRIGNTDAEYVTCVVDSNNFLVCGLENGSDTFRFFYREPAFGGDSTCYATFDFTKAGLFPVVRLSLS
ncbi:hypothetical protein FHETE_5939 [Fusarium heterosporum]|uniref:Uncharacterized protein n=1 Tax=Fusarium heterosporum TaxID=42747 RepID=A0A8H5TCM0_FUSHE|nr:hypothetical protein FHETE_5939 [Fusarium heterosporum]